MNQQASRLGVTTAVALTVLFAGCGGLLGPPVEVAEKQCGNAVGVGGCQVTLENTGDSTETVTVTVEAISQNGDVAATNSRRVRVGTGGPTRVTIAAVSAGTPIDHYEVTVE